MIPGNPYASEIRDMAGRVLASCRIEQTFCLDSVTRTCTLRVPSGDMKYPSFWVRDAVMMAESGLIEAEEMAGWLWLIACAGQNGAADRHLRYGLTIPAWSVADHINFDGGAVFYPGTYGTGDDQGTGQYGLFPPHDDPYFFIELAYRYWHRTQDNALLLEKMHGMTLIDRLDHAFEAYNIDPATGLCTSEAGRHTVDWGFCDTVVKSGYLLFPSLLRYRAARRLTRLSGQLDRPQKAAIYQKAARTIRQSIQDKLTGDSGWLLSATGTGSQKDVWGTAFAVWLDVLEENQEARACKALADAFTDQTAVSRGYVRHIPEGEDASGHSAWQMASCRYNTYQNGGYWGTPVRWYIEALARHDADLARMMLSQYMQHTLEHQADGAPYEWRTRDDSIVDGRLYGASAVFPVRAD